MAARQLPPWVERPHEVANLLNPAFTSLLLRAAVRGYVQESSAGLPLTLAYVVLPVVLHRHTREALPASTRTRLHTWIEANQAITIGFADRARQMVPYTREALIFGAQQRCVALNVHALLEAPPIRLRSTRFTNGSEPQACLDKAHLLGRLLARAGDPTTSLAMWGVRP
jgi:hypothetical protein